MVARPCAQRGGGRNRARCARFGVAALCAATETRTQLAKGAHTDREDAGGDVAGTGALEAFGDDLQT